MRSNQTQVAIQSPATVTPEQRAFLTFLQSPFVQDTLFALTRPASVRVDNSLGPTSAPARGSYDPLYQTIGMHFGAQTSRPKQDTFVHEMGHAIDLGGQPGTIHPAAIDGLRANVRRRIQASAAVGRFGADPEEAFAETFMRSLELLRSFGTNINGQGMDHQISRLDNIFPGARETVNWLVMRGPYNQHPYRAFLEQKHWGSASSSSRSR
jgi:hypothetical protein